MSSSHAHSLLLHLHASPPSSQPSVNISSIILDLLDDKSNKRGKRLRRGTSPTHLSYQKKVCKPSPTFLDILSANQAPLNLAYPTRT